MDLAPFKEYSIADKLKQVNSPGLFAKLKRLCSTLGLIVFSKGSFDGKPGVFASSLLKATQALIDLRQEDCHVSISFNLFRMLKLEMTTGATHTRHRLLIGKKRKESLSRQIIHS